MNITNCPHCPHCQMSVIPDEKGICPSCNKDVNDQTEISRSVREREWEEHIYWGRRQGVLMNKLKEELHEQGYDRTEIEDFVKQRTQNSTSEEKKSRWNGYFLEFVPSFLVLE